MTFATGLLALALLALAAFLVDRLLLWMEWRGWIDYRRTYPGHYAALLFDRHGQRVVVRGDQRP